MRSFREFQSGLFNNLEEQIVAKETHILAEQLEILYFVIQIPAELDNAYRPDIINRVGTTTCGWLAFRPITKRHERGTVKVPLKARVDMVWCGVV